MSNILIANKIKKSYAQNNSSVIEVLKDVDIQIAKNKITVIIGASGAGKSTLLHILSGLDTSDSGEVIIAGTNISSMSDDEMARFRNSNIGFVFQFHHLLPEFSAVENAALPLLVKKTNQQQAFKQAESLLKEFGLGNRLNHKPAELSGGEQQRIAIARSLITNPQIIMADEPTGNLDSVNSKIIHEMFIHLKEKYNQTFLIVSHNPELVKLADEVIEMKDGKIISHHSENSQLFSE